MRRIPELDALRGIAALWVVAYHYSFPFPETHARYFVSGGMAVDLFFVLSGYLISAIIIDHAGEKGFLRSFYVRRGLRIWPAYYVFILGTAALILFRPAMGSLRALPQYLTFTQCAELYWFGKPIELSYHTFLTWTLAIEEQFYLLWPLMIAAVGVRWMVPMALACIAVAISARWVGFRDWILLARSDGFAIGGVLAVALASAQRSGIGPAFSGRLAIVGAACLAYLLAFVPAFGGRGGSPADITVTCVFFGCIVGLVVRHRGHRLLAPLRMRWLCFLGLISYGIYLYHMAAARVAAGVVARAGLWEWRGAGIIAAPVMCLAVALASWYLLEKPFLGLKDRFRYGPGPPVAKAGASTPVAATAEPAPTEPESRGLAVASPVHGPP